MSTRLIKIAKEFNISTDTITSFLSDNGIFIPATPTYILDDEQLNFIYQNRLKLEEYILPLIINGNDETNNDLVSSSEINNIDKFHNIQNTINNYLSLHLQFPNEKYPKGIVSFQYGDLNHEIELPPYFNKSYDKEMVVPDSIFFKYKLLNPEIVNMNDLIRVVSTLFKNFTSNIEQDYFEKSELIENKQVELLFSSEWSDISFRNYYIIYKYNRNEYKFDKHPKSSREYDYIKNFFEFNNFKFKITLLDNKPINIEIPAEIFEYLDLARDLSAFLNRPKFYSTLSLRSVMDKFDNSIDKLLKLFNKKHTKYIQYLTSIHSTEFQIKTIFEPIVHQKNISKFDLSFLFTFNKNRLHYLIWESIEVDKATYVFGFNSLDEYYSGLEIFYSFLYNKNGFQGRMILRDFLRLKQKDHIYHNDNSTTDRQWRNKLNALLGIQY